jgi:hypothetical protein
VEARILVPLAVVDKQELQLEEASAAGKARPVVKLE